MGEFSEKDVRVGLRIRNASGYEWTATERTDCTVLFSRDGAPAYIKVYAHSAAQFILDGRWTVTKPAPAETPVEGFAQERAGNGRDLSPPTQRSGRQFDGVTVRCDRFSTTGRISWPEKACMYKVNWHDDDGNRYVAWYTEQDIADELSCGFWRIVDLAASTISPRDASRRAIDETVRGLRGQLFAAAIQAVLVAACTEGKTGERILSRADIDSMVAACRAWEECRSKVAPGRRTLTPEQLAACWEAATKAGLWLGGSGEVYERARSM